MADMTDELDYSNGGSGATEAMSREALARPMASSISDTEGSEQDGSLSDFVPSAERP